MRAVSGASRVGYCRRPRASEALDGPAAGGSAARRRGPSADFSQRFTGTFSDDGDTIRGTWEKSFDGSHWVHDFDLTYRRVR
jgi:hypothetical protein